MKIKAILATAILAAGCGALPQPVETTAGYHLLGLSDPTLHLGVPTASSTRNAYFPPAHVTDGNERTAWAPAWGDPCPTLCFDLGARTCLTGLSLKASGATVDVWVDGTCKATGLVPKSGAFVKFPLVAEGSKVTLVFHGRDVLVCGVDLCGHAAPSPRPSVMPTATPTVTPTSTPTVTPTATPTGTPTATPTPVATPTPAPSSTPVTCGFQVSGTGNFYAGLVPTGATWAIDVHTTGADGAAEGTVTVHATDGSTYLFELNHLVDTGTGFTASGALSFFGTTLETYSVSWTSGLPGGSLLVVTKTTVSPFATQTFNGTVLDGAIFRGDPCVTSSPIPLPSFLPF